MLSHSDPLTAFKDIDVALLVGARPRGPVAAIQPPPAAFDLPLLVPHRFGQGLPCHRRIQRVLEDNNGNRRQWSWIFGFARGSSSRFSDLLRSLLAERLDRDTARRCWRQPICRWWWL